MSETLRMKAKQSNQSSSSSAPRSARTHPYGDAPESQFMRLQSIVGNQAVQTRLAQRRTGSSSRNVVPVSTFLGLNSSNLNNQIAVDSPESRHEQEADRVAEQVMRMKQPSETSLWDNPRRDPDRAHPQEYEDSRGGHMLPSETRQFFESRFGHDFSDVRLHSDTAAGESARTLEARAYTRGTDISFAPGQLQTSTSEGLQLLAHELAHVVQQSRTSRTNVHTPAASLTRAPSEAIQRKLVATGDTAGFAALVNSILGVQVEVVIGRGGEVSLRSTNVQGPPTPEAAELTAVLRRVINHRGATSIEFIRGATSTRASDRRVFVGSFPQGKIDLDDVRAFGSQESLGLGQGSTGGAFLAHEIQEQFLKQQEGQGFTEAHRAALEAEGRAVGAPRTDTVREIPGGLEVTFTSRYPDGRVVEVKVDVIDGNATNVRRRVLP